MPVVWHERKGKEFNRIFLKPLAKDANERVTPVPFLLFYADPFLPWVRRLTLGIRSILK